MLFGYTSIIFLLLPPLMRFVVSLLNWFIRSEWLMDHIRQNQFEALLSFPKVTWANPLPFTSLRLRLRISLESSHFIRFKNTLAYTDPILQTQTKVRHQSHFNSHWNVTCPEVICQSSVYWRFIIYCKWISNSNLVCQKTAKDIDTFVSRKAEANSMWNVSTLL